MGEMKFRVWDITDDCMYYNITNISDVNGYIMQYTGLKDKNGRGIYGGDIVRCYGGAYWNGIYEYDYVIEVRDIRYLNEVVYSENVEILGNRYENPELLEECEK